MFLLSGLDAGGGGRPLREGTADAEADFRTIYEFNAIHVYRFALSLGTDPVDAEDIVAEAFARAFTSAAVIRAHTARAYLMTIARNYFLETRRGRRHETDLVSSLHDNHALPDASVEMESELSAVKSRLRQLPEIDRAALVMRAVHELSYEDIARSLGISVVAAKVKVHRARRALAATFAGREP